MLFGGPKCWSKGDFDCTIYVNLVGNFRVVMTRCQKEIIVRTSAVRGFRVFDRFDDGHFFRETMSNEIV